MSASRLPTSTGSAVSAGLPAPTSDTPRTFPADFLAAAVDIDVVFARAAASHDTERSASMSRHPSRGKDSARGRATTRERRLARELKYGSAA